jgi:hypothetical protein
MFSKIAKIIKSKLMYCVELYKIVYQIISNKRRKPNNYYK